MKSLCEIESKFSLSGKRRWYHHQKKIALLVVTLLSIPIIVSVFGIPVEMAMIPTGDDAGKRKEEVKVSLFVKIIMCSFRFIRKSKSCNQENLSLFRREGRNG